MTKRPSLSPADGDSEKFRCSQALLATKRLVCTYTVSPFELTKASVIGVGTTARTSRQPSYSLPATKFIPQRFSPWLATPNPPVPPVSVITWLCVPTNTLLVSNENWPLAEPVTTGVHIPLNAPGQLPASYSNGIFAPLI